MSIEHQGQTLYTPREAAQMLGLSVGMLRYLRNEGRIKGTELDTITLYTKEQIEQADVTPRPRGPRKREKQDGNEGRDISVTPHITRPLPPACWVA